MGGRRILSDAQLDVMAELREAGRTYKWIARHFTDAGTPVTESTIAWQCLRLGVISPHCTQASFSRGPTRMGRPFTDEEDARLLALEGQGLSRAAIGRAIGRRPNSVAGRLYTLARRDMVAEECPVRTPAAERRERRRAASTRHHCKRQLERARQKVARLEEKYRHVQ